MDKLTFNEIIDRVASAVGHTQPSTHVQAQIKRHLYDELVETHLIAEDIKEEVEYVIYDGSAPDFTPTINLGVPVEIPAGTYKYKFLYRTTNHGDTLPTEEYSYTLGTTGSIRIEGLPASLPVGVSSLVILRTKQNGGVFFELATVSSGVTAYEDDTLDAGLPASAYSVVETADTQGITVPSKYIAIRESSFWTADKQSKFAKAELTEEDYMNWKPSVSSLDPTVPSVTKMATGEEPYYVSRNSELNKLLDGKVGYVIQDRLPIIFNWKPKITGYVKMLVIVTPLDSIMTSLTANPDLLAAFYSILVNGGAERFLIAELSAGKVDKEAQLYSKQTALRIFTSKKDKALKRYQANVQKKVGTSIVRGNPFLVDPDMEIHSP